MHAQRSPTLPDRIASATLLLHRAATASHPAALASSFGAEDMVLLDLVARNALPVRVFTIDTGRLPQQTHDLADLARSRYALDLEVFVPQAAAVEDYVRRHGSNACYGSVELRERCCAIRKVEPLARALRGARAWITGLRRAQGVTRTDVAFEGFDERYGLVKFNPLADWSDDDVWAYVDAHDVPVNALHRAGYPSIGCAPCTRAVAPGEDPRAGRWWWEHAEHRECGLHRRPIEVSTSEPSVADARS
jgi:phosphoadenosine phosphosulfate reductase